jgi:hypothetical protein
LGRNGLAEQVLGDDERWVLLRRCLHDDALSLRVRVAGALVLLYGQLPSRIVELTVDHITTTDTDTYLALHEQPALLPPPLATLTTRLAAQNRQREQIISRSGTPTWLFAGARAGSHLDRGHLSKLLNKEIGVFIRPARGAAVSALAADLPAPVLAVFLGLSISTATRWAAHTARDDADYLAARITHPPRDLTASSPFAGERRFDVGTRAQPSPVTAQKSWSEGDATMTGTPLPLAGLAGNVVLASVAEQLVLIGQPRPFRVPEQRCDRGSTTQRSSRGLRRSVSSGQMACAGLGLAGCHQRVTGRSAPRAYRDRQDAAPSPRTSSPTNWPTV